MRYFSLFIGLLLVTSAQAQERKNPVQNVRIRVIDSSKIEIRYDLLTTRTGDSVYFEVKSRRRGSAIKPSADFVTGDLGTNIEAGTDRRILWDAQANGITLNEEIRVNVLLRTATPTVTESLTTTPSPKASPRVTETPAPPVVTQRPTDSPTSEIKQPEKPVVQAPVPPVPPTESVQPDTVQVQKQRYAGPGWALLSVLAPGVGNIFVQTPRPRVGLRPVLTIGCYGLVAYGLLERQKAQNEYALYEQQRNASAAEPFYQRANSHHHRYFLATRGAILIAATDVILTIIRGINNEREQRINQRPRTVTWRPGFQAGQPTAVVSLSF